MKKYLLLILVMSMALGASAQLRHVKGINAAEAGYGIGKYGYQIQVGFSRFLNQKSYVKALLYQENTKLRSLSSLSYGMDVSYNYTLYKIKNVFYANAKGGAAFLIDKLKNDDTNDLKTFKYGILVGVELEYFISSRFQLVLGGNQKYLPQGNNWGNVRYIFSSAIRVKI